MVCGKKIRILIADSQLAVRQAIAASIRSHPDLNIVAEASDSDQTIQCFLQYQPDILVMELGLPTVASGIETVKTTLANSPDARIVILSMHEGVAAILLAIAAGISSYLFKTMDTTEVLEEICSIYARAPRFHSKILTLIDSVPHKAKLTPTECEVLMMIEEDLSSENMRNKLTPRLDELATQTHIASIFRKLGADNYMGAIRRGINGCRPISTLTPADRKSTNPR